MKLNTLTNLMAVALLATGNLVQAADSTAPIAGPDLVFEETGGFVAVEAEHFFQQTHTEKRAWHLTTAARQPKAGRDGDGPHVIGASGGAYLEILPDTRRNAREKLIAGENFSDDPGNLAVIHYKVHFNTPGRYYVWARAFSTGAEDNGLHVGLNDQWPDAGKRLQWCEGKNTWRWESKQRTPQEHCGEPYKIYLDVENAGVHTIMFSLREDGFEFDRWIMTTDRNFARPNDAGPASRVKSGQMPAPFPVPPGYTESTPTPAAPAAPSAGATPASAWPVGLVMKASEFPVEKTGYYLDRNRWLAINPERNKTAKAEAKFPFASGKYAVTLQAVGESDGKSTYELFVNDKSAGTFVCPLSAQTYEEGQPYAKTWPDVEVKQGDTIRVTSQIASEDGVEHSRARWAWLHFSADGKPPVWAAATTANAAVAAPAPAEPAVPAVPLVLPRKPDGSGAVEISGELKQWHKVTLTLDGPYAHERDNEPNPFTDYRLTVTFTHESGTPAYRVPGYFAADGNAANTSAEAGTQWRAHLSPDKVGKWNYTVAFLKGRQTALADKPAGQGLAPFDGKTGSFTVAPSDKTGRDFRAQGRLQYVGKHYLQFAGSKEYFLKAGADAPENLLAYTDFDATYSNKRGTVRAGEATPEGLKTWEPHVRDWRPGDPTWKGGKGRGLIGALNYLSGKGCNVFSFLTYNAGGDGDDVWPFVARNDKMHYDCSKLDQWSIVFDHATPLGLYLHFKMQETEMDDNRHGKGQGRVPTALDGGDLGPERRLYCRELIARYGHALALNWNLGEENTQSPEQQRAMSGYIKNTDPYGHNIVVHTFPNQQDQVYEKLIGDQSVLTGVSLQNGWNQTHKRTLKWVTESAKAGRPWVVANDEQGPAGLGAPPDPGYEKFGGKASENNQGGYDLHDIRKCTLWGNLMAGGAGVEYYFGYKLPQNDLVCHDWRSRDKSWDYCRIALEFFKQNAIPFWEMKNANALVGNTANDNTRFCFAKPGELYLVYLCNGGAAELDLGNQSRTYSVKWFNPRSGGVLQDGSVKSVKGAGKISLGQPPADPAEDWLIVVR